MRITDFVVIASQCFWCVCEIFIKRTMTAKSGNADQTSYKALYSITIAGVALGIAAGWFLRFDNVLGLYFPSVAFPIIGSAVIVAGMIFRLTAIKTLKGFFTVNVAILDGHRLITSGPYKYIRHPAYAGGLLSFLGCGICYGNIPSLVLIFIPYFILILIRIRQEEPVLIKQFGQEYVDLQAKTKKIIPFVF